MINNKSDAKLLLKETANCKKLLKITAIFTVCFMIAISSNSCLGGKMKPFEEGIFNEVPIIEMIKPENKSQIVIESPYFKWETTRIGVSGIFPYELVVIFNKDPEVDGLSLTKETMKEHALWMWDSNRSDGTPGNVKLSEFYFAKTQEISNGEFIFVFDEEENNNQTERPNLKKYKDENTDFDGDFYWIVIQYDSYGKIKKASKSFRFSFKEINPINDETIGEDPINTGD